MPLIKDRSSAEAALLLEVGDLPLKLNSCPPQIFGGHKIEKLASQITVSRELGFEFQLCRRHHHDTMRQIMKGFVTPGSYGVLD